MIYLLKAHLYLDVLFSACIVTAGRVIFWVMNSGDIDPGEPNASVGFDNQSVRTCKWGDIPIPVETTRSGASIKFSAP
jgi:hypothetical protein